ncbi:exonuclease domain-containing protein [Haloferula sp.]|uniref:3'-5' exonuclease n=1 Tax=Haloferula sp. TaxID=2497595 RepID=UPI003C744321
MTPETPIRLARFAGIDFESAGAARGRTDVPVQIGLANWSISDGHSKPFMSYLKSSGPITWSAQKVHGIREEDLKDAPSLLELWPTVRDQLSGAVVVAHGKGTEKRFLRAFPGHGFGPWVDTLLLSRAAWPELPEHSLSALCLHRKLEDRIRAHCPQGNWHDALFDTVASLALLEDIVTSFDLVDLPLAQLVFPDTREWHQQRSR